MEIIWNLPDSTLTMPSTGRSTHRILRTSGPLAGSITFQCREYEPEAFKDFNHTAYYWREGNAQRRIDLPPYAVQDINSLMIKLEQYLATNQRRIETWTVEYTKCHGNWPAYTTYREAIRQRDQSSSILLDLALKLQCGAVASQGYGTVRSLNKGMQDVDYTTYGFFGYEAYNRKRVDRPLPAAINHQMDVAILKLLQRLEQELLKRLKKIIPKSDVKPWYELFLTFFVLLFNLEYIDGSSERYISSKRQTVSKMQHDSHLR